MYLSAYDFCKTEIVELGPLYGEEDAWLGPPVDVPPEPVASEEDAPLVSKSENMSPNPDAFVATWVWSPADVVFVAAPTADDWFLNVAPGAPVFPK